MCSSDLAKEEINHNLVNITTLSKKNPGSKKQKILVAKMVPKQAKAKTDFKSKKTIKFGAKGSFVKDTHKGRRGLTQRGVFHRFEDFPGEGWAGRRHFARE